MHSGSCVANSRKGCGGTHPMSPTEQRYWARSLFHKGDFFHVRPSDGIIAYRMKMWEEVATHPGLSFYIF